MSNTPGLDFVMHDRRRRAERKGDAMRASFQPTKRTTRDSSCSDMERLEGDAAATIESGWNFAAPIDINDPNKTENEEE